MKEVRDNTSRVGGLPTLPCLYYSTFQPSQRGFYRIRVCEGGDNWRQFIYTVDTRVSVQRRYDMNGRFQMQGGKNWILPKEIKANRFFWDSHWLEIWSNHFCPSMGPSGGSVAMDSVGCNDFDFLKEKK